MTALVFLKAPFRSDHYRGYSVKAPETGNKVRLIFFQFRLV
jgi:hypothetical protein